MRFKGYYQLGVAHYSAGKFSRTVTLQIDAASFRSIIRLQFLWVHYHHAHWGRFRGSGAHVPQQSLKLGCGFRRVRLSATRLMPKRRDKNAVLMILCERLQFCILHLK